MKIKYNPGGVRPRNQFLTTKAQTAQKGVESFSFFIPLCDFFAFVVKFKRKLISLGFRPVFFLLFIFSAVFFPALSAAQSATPMTGNTETLLTGVSELMARREFTAALELFDRLDESVAQKSEIQLLRASVLNSAGRTRDARVIASGIISREPNNVDALLVLASSAAAEGNHREQRTFLERVLRIDPRNLKAMSDLGYIALRSQSLRTAAGHFDRALAIDENYREALVGRAVV